MTPVRPRVVVGISPSARVPRRRGRSVGTMRVKTERKGVIGMLSRPGVESTTIGRTATRPRPHIVVGVDGGIGGWMALGWARDEAMATAGRLTICHAGMPPAGGPSMDALTLADPPMARAVHDVRQRIGGQRVDLRFAPGDPTGLIVGAAAHADLVVVGPPLHGGARSTALRTAGTSPCPVMIVRPGHDEPRLPFTGHVVAALGGGTCDARIADFAMRHADIHHLPVAAVHVTADGLGDFWFDEDTLETHFTAEPPSIEMLARVMEPLRTTYPGVAVRLCVLAGAPAVRLVTTASSAHLIVIGRRRHRRPGPKLGGTSGAVARTTIAPVAVIPPM